MTSDRRKLFCMQLLCESGILYAAHSCCTSHARITMPIISYSLHNIQFSVPITKYSTFG